METQFQATLVELIRYNNWPTRGSSPPVRSLPPTSSPLPRRTRRFLSIECTLTGRCKWVVNHPISQQSDAPKRNRISPTK